MYSDNMHCAPGAVFRMTEDGLVSKLDTLCDAYPDALRLDRTAGVFQLYKIGPLESIRILQGHYAADERLVA